MSAELLSLTPLQSVGIPVALVGSIFLAVGSEFQQRGVVKSQSKDAEADSTRLKITQFLQLARRPSWLIGTGLSIVAIVLQLVSLWLAPLTVVQPVGALALVISAVIDARVTGHPLRAPAVRAIVICVVGVTVFVVAAALTTSTVAIHDLQLIAVLAVLVGLLVIAGVTLLVLHGRVSRIFNVVTGGVFFGFVATLAKVLITRIEGILHDGFHASLGDWLTVACFVGLIISGLFGVFSVQSAYASGSPDVVVAGLTVIDPIVGVTVGITILGEAGSAPAWAGVVFVASGLVAIFGVIQLSRRHPATSEADAAPVLEQPSSQ